MSGLIAQTTHTQSLPEPTVRFSSAKTRKEKMSDWKKRFINGSLLWRGKPSDLKQSSSWMRGKSMQTPKKSGFKVAEHSLAVCAYMSFAKSRQGKDCSSQAETWQVKNILMEDFYWQVKFDFLEVSMATRTIEYNLKISLLLSLQKNHSLDFSINLHTAYYN